MSPTLPAAVADMLALRPHSPASPEFGSPSSNIYHRIAPWCDPVSVKYKWNEPCSRLLTKWLGAFRRAALHSSVMTAANVVLKLVHNFVHCRPRLDVDKCSGVTDVIGHHSTFTALLTVVSDAFDTSRCVAKNHFLYIRGLDRGNLQLVTWLSIWHKLKISYLLNWTITVLICDLDTSPFSWQMWSISIETNFATNNYVKPFLQFGIQILIHTNKLPVH